VALSALLIRRNPIAGSAVYPFSDKPKEEGMKRILCGDLVPGCAFKAQAETEVEVLHVETDHARAAHGINVTSEFLARARERIVDVEAPAAAKKRAAGGRQG
jgi:predicted small metal-binding protein